MGAKKFFGWLVVGIVLLMISAIILAGALINSKIVSSRKPESMKEAPCPKGTYHTVVKMDGKTRVYCAPKIQKVLAEVFIKSDIYINLDGKRTYAGKVEIGPKNIKVTNSGAVDSLSVLLIGSMLPPEANLNLEMIISVRGKAKEDMPEGFFKRTATVPNLFGDIIDVFVLYFDDAREKPPWTRSDEGYHIDIRTGKTTVIVKEGGRWRSKNNPE